MRNKVAKLLRKFNVSEAHKMASWTGAGMDKIDPAKINSDVKKDKREWNKLSHKQRGKERKNIESLLGIGKTKEAEADRDGDRCS